MFPSTVYQNRRNQLKKRVEKGVVLMLGNQESPMNYPDNTYKFRQDSTFLYFWGLDIPGIAAAIDIDNDREIIFGDDYSIDQIIWMGPQVSMKDNAAKAGVDTVFRLSQMNEFIQNSLKKGTQIHFTPPYRADNQIYLSELLHVPVNKVKECSSLKLVKACIDLRSVKESCEIEEIEKHMEVGARMHLTAMKMAHPGIRESAITAAVESIATESGGMIAFPVICSVRGETLHNHCHSNVLKKGDLLLVDAGSESAMHYATDHTRTSPVGGHFSQMQKEIYQVVLNANLAVQKSVRPGIPYRDVHFIAATTITKGLIEIGLMKGDPDEAVQRGAHTLFFPHGIGHMMGLDVHDMEDYDDSLVGYDEVFIRSKEFGLKSLRLARPLKTGFVLTNEPGIYFIPALIDQWKREKKNSPFIRYDRLDAYMQFGGIRIEDDLLVTDQGCRLLGPSIPKMIEEVTSTVLSGIH